MRQALSDAWWDRMLRAGGGITQDYRAQIAEVLRQRFEREGDAYMRATEPTRKLLKDTIGFLAASVDGLTRLERNAEFLHYNLRLSPEDHKRHLAFLPDGRAHLTALLGVLTEERKRFKRRSIKNVEVYLRSGFFTQLLEIRTKALKRDEVRFVDILSLPSNMRILLW